MRCAFRLTLFFLFFFSQPAHCSSGTLSSIRPRAFPGGFTGRRRGSSGKAISFWYALRIVRYFMTPWELACSRQGFVPADSAI